MVISLISLGFSIYLGLRDRGNLKVICRFFPANEYNQEKYIYISAVNHGRRTVHLLLIYGLYEDNSISGEFLKSTTEGIKLGEHEKYEKRITSLDSFLISFEDGCLLTDFWFEDALGRKYKIKNAKKTLRIFFEE